MSIAMKRTVFTLFTVVFLMSSCTPGQPETASGQLEDQLDTMVAMTLTALPTTLPALTSTPLPTPTETATPTQIVVSPTAISFENIVAPTAKPEYACNMTRREPADDTEIRRDTQFDIEWTLINTGTQQWEKGTTLIYQNGTKMTEIKELELPRLKPGETYDIALRATAPSERDLQIMVWAVVGPGKAKGSEYWMCYPYVRIIVTK